MENWRSRWFPKGSFKELLREDELIRRVINEKIGAAGIASLEIERTANTVRVHRGFNKSVGIFFAEALPQRKVAG